MRDDLGAPLSWDLGFLVLGVLLVVVGRALAPGEYDRRSEGGATMPLFMDRHDVPGATAKDVADAHVSDLEKAAKHSVQFLSYWFDAETGGVFCFANAPSPQSLEAVHRESHGLVPNEIIGVSEDDVLRFLGRIHDPTQANQLASPFRTILFTDLEGSTAILEAVGDAKFLALLAEHDMIIRRAVFTWRGREVKHTGDGIMAAFDDVANALHSALAIQAGFSSRSASGESPDLRVRIGMAAGQPVDRNDDIYGSAVVLANRICSTADAGHTLVSDVVHEIGVERGFRFQELGTRPLKGFSVPAPVFELVTERPASQSRPVPRQIPRRGGRLQRWVTHTLRRS